jgi:hypothetical protein
LHRSRLPSVYAFADGIGGFDPNAAFQGKPPPARVE